jgi:hypothetical protein
VRSAGKPRGVAFEWCIERSLNSCILPCGVYSPKPAPDARSDSWAARNHPKNNLLKLHWLH